MGFIRKEYTLSLILQFLEIKAIWDKLKFRILSSSKNSDIIESLFGYFQVIRNIFDFIICLVFRETTSINFEEQHIRV